MNKEIEKPIAKRDEKEKKEDKINKDLLITNLVNLLKDNKLSVDSIRQEAEKLSVDSYALCYRILIKSKLLDDFYNYSLSIGVERATINDEERILYSFFEKIQKQERASVGEEQTVSESIEPEEKEAEQFEQEESLSKQEEAEIIPKPEKKNWREVKRETEIMAVEDLSGDIRTFEKHVKELGVAKKDASGYWQWTGENKKLVFLGDILGDRDMDGMEVTSIIGDLSDQAEKKEGKVDFLCGNHDMDFILFLCKAGSDEYAKKNSGWLSDQSIDTWELAKFDPEPNSELRKINPLTEIRKFREHESELWPKLYEKMPEILLSMRSDPEGKNILENICRIKIAVIYDDTLFCHTDPTMEMISDLTENGNISKRVAEINRIFQENLRKALFEDARFDDDFKQIQEIYLNANNRDYFAEQESFEGLAEDLLEKIAVDLHKKGRLKVGKQSRDIFDKDQWLYWEWKVLVKKMLNKVESINIDESALGKYIKEWGKDNKIKGDFAKEVANVFKAISSRNSGKLVKANRLLIDKIKELNPKKDNVAKVKNSGINAIIHGHSPLSDRYYDKDDFIIVSPHASFSDEEGGISTIKKNGGIVLIGKNFRK